MVAQHGLKGTSCPSHYHVIKDDCNDNVELLQKLTFELCHLYARATKIVSRPAPVYYAHRAAFLAQYYKDDYKEDNMWEVSPAINLTLALALTPHPHPHLHSHPHPYPHQVGSMCSNGSTGSGGSGHSIPDIRLGPNVANTVYFA